MIEFTCGTCGNVMHVQEALAGRKGKCQRCGNLLVVPAATTIADAGPPAAARGMNPASEPTPPIPPPPSPPFELSGPPAPHEAASLHAATPVAAASARASLTLCYVLAAISFLGSAGFIVCVFLDDSAVRSAVWASLACLCAIFLRILQAEIHENRRRLESRRG
jgi:hypothetical protein